jgi:hypothetical protein
VQAVEHVGHVFLGGRGADAENGSDIPIGRSGRDELDDPPLPRGEAVELWPV